MLHKLSLTKSGISRLFVKHTKSFRRINFTFPFVLLLLGLYLQFLQTFLI